MPSQINPAVVFAFTFANALRLGYLATCSRGKRYYLDISTNIRLLVLISGETLLHDGNDTQATSLGLFPARAGNRHYPSMAVCSTETIIKLAD